MSVVAERARGHVQRAVGVARFARSRDYPQFFVQMTSMAPRVAYIPMPIQPFWVLSHPELIHDVLVTRGSIMEKGPSLQILSGLLGEGLLTAPRAVHRPQRRLIQPAFHPRRLDTYEDLMRTAGAQRAASWCDGQEIVLDDEMSALTLRVVGEALFGDDLDEEVSRVSGGLSAALEEIGGWMAVPGFHRYPQTPLPGARRLRAATTGLRDLVGALAARRRAEPGGTDLLSDLLAAQQQHPEFTDARLVDELLTILLAGHETTAMALTWTLLLLADNPAVLATLQAEVDRVGVGGDPRTELPFTRAVVAEGMRLRPPAWALERTPTELITLDGRHVPPGGPLRMSQYAMHRDPRFWPRAAAFEPQRWLDADGAFGTANPGQPDGAYFPFGAASRICIGEQFAWSEAVLLLAGIVARWDVVPLTPGMPRERPSVTLRPAEPVRVRLRAR